VKASEVALDVHCDTDTAADTVDSNMRRLSKFCHLSDKNSEHTTFLDSPLSVLNSLLGTVLQQAKFGFWYLCISDTITAIIHTATVSVFYSGPPFNTTLAK
jgi:hypothetical protein